MRDDEIEEAPGISRNTDQKTLRFDESIGLITVTVQVMEKCKLKSSAGKREKSSKKKVEFSYLLIPRRKVLESPSGGE